MGVTRHGPKVLKAFKGGHSLSPALKMEGVMALRVIKDTAVHRTTRKEF